MLTIITGTHRKKQPNMMTIEKIEEIVCKVRDVDPDDLKKKRGKIYVTETRMIIMYLAYYEYKIKSSQKIADYYKMSHCMVLHSKKNINDYLFSDHSFEQNFNHILSQLHFYENINVGNEKILSKYRIKSLIKPEYEPIYKDFKKLLNNITVGSDKLKFNY